MGRKLTAITAALVMLSMVLAFSAVAAPVGAKDSKTMKIVETRDVDLAFTFTLADLATSDLVDLIPAEILYSIDPDTEVNVRLDGKLHINAMVSEKKDALDVDMHVVWHGTIGLQIADMPEFVFDFKNAQLKMSGSVPAAIEDMDLKVNFHINGQVSVDGAEEGLDLSTHVLLKINDGQITSLKIWLPELLEEHLLDL